MHVGWGRVERVMPLLRYFAYVGGVLFALLFVANFYLPKVPVVESSGPHMPVIHLYAERRGPERIVFDTSTPAVNPAALAPAASADKGHPAQAAAANVSSKVRDALAELPPSEASAVQPADAKKAEAKPPPRKARRHAAPPMRLVYRQPQFGWFGPQQRYW